MHICTHTCPRRQILFPALSDRGTLHRLLSYHSFFCHRAEHGSRDWAINSLTLCLAGVSSTMRANYINFYFHTRASLFSPLAFPLSTVAFHPPPLAGVSRNTSPCPYLMDLLLFPMQVNGSHLALPLYLDYPGQLTFLTIRHASR